MLFILFYLILAISEENMESEDLLKENEHDTAVDNIDSSPRFVVTLDGVNHEEFMKNHGIIC